EPGSLRAAVVSGNGKVVDVRAQFDVQLAEEIDVPAELKAVEAAQAKLKSLETKLSRVDTEIGELKALRPAFLEHKRGEPPRPAPVEAMLALGDFREAELAARLATRREVSEAIVAARRELTLHEARLQEASSAQRSERTRVWRVAKITLAEAPNEPLKLSLEYRVPSARWVPSYALTLERGLTGGSLQMRASVIQKTGEDWNGVSLSLSTASSNRSAEMPELKALKLGRRQEAPPRSGWREPPPGLDSLFESYDAATHATIDSMALADAPSFGASSDKKRGGPPAKPVAMNAPPPPPPAPAPVMASLGGVMAEKAASRSMPRPGAAMPPPAARASAAMPPAPKGGGGSMRRREMEVAASYDDSDGFAEIAADEMAPEEESSSGAYDTGAQLESETRLDASFGDYARLTMPDPTAASNRGRLTEMSQSMAAFVGVSVQIDVVMAMVNSARSAARAADNVALPALTNPVSSVKSFDYRYDCQARVDVPSTGKWVLVPVMNCAVGLTPEYVCVPSVEPKVYRTLTVANRSAHALLAGPVDVTAGDEFLMTTSLPAISPGAEQSHRLGLGVEEAIKVARKTQFNETTGGFLGGSTVLPHSIEIDLNNRLATAALIEVRERIPVADPNDKDLKVEETSVVPPWEKVETPIDEELIRGARRWRVTVPPGQQQKLTASFAIRIPSDKMIVGGNRRS
ncbi:MAG: DUF4139 domain-containing protein, partial [Archangium sp.]